MKNSKIKALVLAGGLVLTTVGLSGCSSNYDLKTIQVETMETKKFAIGEHIISVPISHENDVREKNIQYKYYPGYEPSGISITAHGKFDNDFGGGAIIYSNVEEVECSSDLVDKNGNYLYLNFGTPTYTNEEEYGSNNSIKEFDVGQHIISVPIGQDNRFDQFQYEYHDGYEVVGMATSAHGMFDNDFGGGILLYKNITPVKCTRVESGEYGFTSFGVPRELVKVKTLE